MNKLKSTKEFYEAVEEKKLSIVYFYTKWCPDCFMIKPALPRLEKEFPNIIFPFVIIILCGFVTLTGKR